MFSAMNSSDLEPPGLSFHPLTQKLWRDFEILFGSNGACGGCWCMYWKLRGQSFDENRGDKARQLQKSWVDSKQVPGLLAYLDGYPVGWIAVEPRRNYPKLAHSRSLKPLDDQEVWAVPCFFVEKKSRRKGIAVELLKAAIDYVKKKSGRIVEGYPMQDGENQPDPFLFTGTVSVFEKAGFKEAGRHSPRRPIYRFQFTESDIPG